MGARGIAESHGDAAATGAANSLAGGPHGRIVRVTTAGNNQDIPTRDSLLFTLGLLEQLLTLVFKEETAAFVAAIEVGLQGSVALRDECQIVVDTGGIYASLVPMFLFHVS